MSTGPGQNALATELWKRSIVLRDHRSPLLSRAVGQEPWSGCEHTPARALSEALALSHEMPRRKLPPRTPTFHFRSASTRRSRSHLSAAPDLIPPPLIHQ